MADEHSISEVVKERRERAGKILLLSWRDDVEVLLEAKELMAEMCVALPALLDALEGQPSHNATIEECAKVARGVAKMWREPQHKDRYETARDIEEGIRSLAQPSPVGKGLEVMTPSGRGDGSDDISRLAAFAKDVIRLAWDAAVDGGDVQDAAERHGLIVLASYDPAEHGDPVEADPGEEIFVFADWLKAIQKAIGGETRGEARQSSNSRMERMEEAAQIARDQVSDDPQPGTWNDACEHIANVIARLALDEEKAGA